MKKAMIVICILVLVLSSFSVGFAAETDKVGAEEEPARFVGTFSHQESLSIDSSGKATFSACLTPKNDDAMDRVVVTIKIEHLDGTSVLNKTYTAEWWDIASCYKALDSKSVTKKGKYVMTATYKCYKGSSLIEKLSGSTTDTY